MDKYGVLVRTSAAIILGTCFAMFLLSKGIWQQQLWFKVKMALTILIVLNGVFVGKAAQLCSETSIYGSNEIRGGSVFAFGFLFYKTGKIFVKFSQNYFDNFIIVCKHSKV